jgi:hypothetical protein
VDGLSGQGLLHRLGGAFVNVEVTPEDVQLLHEAIEAHGGAFADAIADGDWEAAARVAAFAALLSRVEESLR